MTRPLFPRVLPSLRPLVRSDKRRAAECTCGCTGSTHLVDCCKVCPCTCCCRRQSFEAAKAHPAASILQLQAAILGGDDFAASLGATRTPDNSELAHARSQFLLTCRAMQVGQAGVCVLLLCLWLCVWLSMFYLVPHATRPIGLLQGSEALETSKCT